MRLGFSESAVVGDITLVKQAFTFGNSRSMIQRFYRRTRHLLHLVKEGLLVWVINRPCYSTNKSDSRRALSQSFVRNDSNGRTI